MKAGWKEVRLGEVMSLNVDSIEIDPFRFYEFAGVYGFGKGLFKREPLLGSNTSYKSFNRLHANTLVMSKVKGWEGAIALVTDEFEGLYLSPMYPTFKADEKRLDINFLAHFCQRTQVWSQLLATSKGIGARRHAITENGFLNLTIPLPPLAEQQRIVARLDAVKANLTEMERLRAQQAKDVKALLFAHYTRLVENAQWMPMREVAPIVRRPVAIDPDQNYPELGIRSFGKGTFHKPPMRGSELTWQKPFWLKAGDLVFSNIKAWEGAVAVVQPEDDGRVGSHRYISCIPDLTKTSADFLFYYFQTPEGIDKLNVASPGSADRNRTLNTKKLIDTLVPIPTSLAQAEFLALRATLHQMQSLHTQSAAWLGQLMPSLLAGAFGGGE